MSEPSSTRGEGERLLRAEGLAKAYPNGVQALGGVDCDVRAGEIVGLIGTNGSGKTTLLKIAAGQARADRGRVETFGLSPESNAARARLAYVSQEPALDPEMTGRETAYLVARLHGLPRDQARRVLEEMLVEFGLAAKADSLVATYSGGMRQRLHLLLGFLHQPLLALLDEPFDSLDPPGRGRFWDFLAGHTRCGGAVLVSLHDLAEASEKVARVRLLAQGRLLADGTPRDLVARHGCGLLKLAFSRPLSEDAGLREKLAGCKGVLEVDPGPEELSVWIRPDASGPEVGSEAEAEVFAMLEAAGAQVQSLQRRLPDLASVFRRLSGEAFRASAKDAGMRARGSGGGRRRGRV